MGTQKDPEAAIAAELSAYGEEVILKDGGSIRLRAVGAPDRQRVRAFFDRLSPRSSRYRFFGAVSSLPSAEVSRIAGLDPGRTVALAAIDDSHGDEDIVGIAEFATRPRVDGSPAASQDPHRAEFAVAVADDHQDRGIGTLLLERTAAAAQRSGIDELEAYVLADNAEMLDVFAKSGFQIQGSRDHEQCKVVFQTAQTEQFVAASLERERLAARESVRVFFEPRSVAVVGVSRKEGSIGRAIVENLVKAGFPGPIYPVNSNLGEVSGLTCFSSLLAVGKPIDLVVIAVPAAQVESVVADCAHVHARGVVVVSSGFGEMSPEGKAREIRLRHQVRNAGMRLVGPNCMGVLNAADDIRLNATFAPVWPPSGNVSMLSQSGALGIAMLDYARQLNIGLAGFVSVGNKADVSVNDLLSYWADDPKTRVIVLYLESFGNTHKFVRLAPEVARKKPIVAVKSGRSAAGTRAASSHSAALASLDVGIDALFAQAGVIRTNTLEELFDVVALLSTQPSPKGPRVGVVTNAGGPGILLADACEAHGLALPSLSPSTLEALRRILPPQAGLSNPIDMIASASPDQFEQAIALVGNDPLVDSVVTIYIPPLVTKPEEVARGIARGAAAIPKDKPIVTVFMSSKGAPPVLAEGARGKIPSFAFPENAALALSAALGHSRFQQRPRGNLVSIPRENERRIRRLVDDALRASGGASVWLSTQDLTALLDLAGIPFAPSKMTLPDPDAAGAAGDALGYPVVLKAVAKTLIHKSDVGGVSLGLGSREALRDAAAEMKTRMQGGDHTLEGFLIQRQIDGGIEALVGVTRDRALGPVIVAGLGGVQVELLGDVAFRLPPISDLDAREMLDHLKAKRLFDGFRGAPPADRAALVDVICKVSALVDIVPEIAEIDLNPIKVLMPERGVVVVDARIRIGIES